MNVIAQLPPRLYFTKIQGTDQWPYIWESRDSDRLRIYSKLLDPWTSKQYIGIRNATAKTDRLVKTNRVDLRCYPAPDPDSPSVPAELVYERAYGGIAHSDRPTLRFYSLPGFDRETRSHPIFVMLSIVAVE